MNKIESKEKLKKDGYTWFDIKDFDENFYNFLLPYKCNETKNLKEKINSLRADAVTKFPEQSHQIQNQFKSFEDASKVKEEFLENIKEKNVRIEQLWFYSDKLEDILTEQQRAFEKFQSHIYDLVRYYFDFEQSQQFVFFAPCLTYYDTKCQLKNHSDGTGTGRICALLIYLNEDYNESDGGCLILNNTESVVPTFGKVAIIDLQTFDIPHMVTEVTGGIGRYALLSFVKKKEDEFIHSFADREKTLM